MKHFLLLLLPILGASMTFAYDIDGFINRCKEMPDAIYTVQEGDQMRETFNALSNSPTSRYLSAKENENVDSILQNITKIQAVIFMDMDLFNALSDKNADKKVDSGIFDAIKAAAAEIDGYEEYVYKSVIPAMAGVDQPEYNEMYDEMTAHLTDAQKEEFKELLNTNFKLAIFGEHTAGMEYKNPVYIFSFIGVTEMLAMEGIVPIVNIDSWVNSIQF